MIDWTHDGVEYFWKESKYTNATLSGRLAVRLAIVDRIGVIQILYAHYHKWRDEACGWNPSHNELDADLRL